jgi:hypothetical protein
LVIGAGVAAVATVTAAAVAIGMLSVAPTYLPIADWPPGKDGQYDVITWLRPTPALLAQLALPVPPGFSSCQHTKCI